MCFGKKEKPLPNAAREKNDGPRPAGQPQASGQRPASGGQSAYNPTPPALPVNATRDRPQPSRERRRPRSRSTSQLRPESDERRASRRQSGLNNPDRGITIAVMGITGAGKSYFIREVTGNPEVKVSAGLYTHTSRVQPYSFDYAGTRITLVDTPGFNNTERTDAEVLQEIADWTTATYRKKRLLSGIIYLHPITDTRMEGSAVRNLRMLKNLCGEEVLVNVLLTTTQWSKVDPAEGQAREDNLRDEGLWGGLISRGATLQRFHGTRESGLELIQKLMSQERKPLRIQDEIVKQHMTLPQTDAGKFLNEALAAQEKRFRKELESLEKQFREAIKAKDAEMNRIFVSEQARAREKLEKAVAELRLLEGLDAAEVERAGPSSQPGGYYRAAARRSIS